MTMKESMEYIINRSSMTMEEALEYLIDKNSMKYKNTDYLGFLDNTNKLLISRVIEDKNIDYKQLLKYIWAYELGHCDYDNIWNCYKIIHKLLNVYMYNRTLNKFDIYWFQKRLEYMKDKLGIESIYNDQAILYVAQDLVRLGLIEQLDIGNIDSAYVTDLGRVIYTILNYYFKYKEKWCIVQEYNRLLEYNIYTYKVEIQKDNYPKDRPPLKSDFNSKEEAEEWLRDYLEKESLFKSAKDDVDNIVQNLDYIREKLQRHEYITHYEWTNCFRPYNASRTYGALSKVTKG